MVLTGGTGGMVLTGGTGGMVLTGGIGGMVLTGGIGGVVLTGGTEVLGEKPVPVPHCAPQILHVLAWDCTSAVRGLQLTA
jgi:hypothetical protein